MHLVGVRGAHGLAQARRVDEAHVGGRGAQLFRLVLAHLQRREIGRHRAGALVGPRRATSGLTAAYERAVGDDGVVGIGRHDEAVRGLVRGAVVAREPRRRAVGLRRDDDAVRQLLPACVAVEAAHRAGRALVGHRHRERRAGREGLRETDEQARVVVAVPSDAGAGDGELRHLESAVQVELDACHGLGDVIGDAARQHGLGVEVVAGWGVVEREVVGIDPERRVAVSGHVRVGAAGGGVVASHARALRSRVVSGVSSSSSSHGPMGLPSQRVLSGTLSPRMTSDVGPTVA